jgi:hypothetical protein
VTSGVDINWNCVGNADSQATPMTTESCWSICTLESEEHWCRSLATLLRCPSQCSYLGWREWLGPCATGWAQLGLWEEEVMTCTSYTMSYTVGFAFNL